MQILLKFASNNDNTFEDQNIRRIQGTVYKKISDVVTTCLENHPKLEISDFEHFCFSDIYANTRIKDGLTPSKSEGYLYFSTSLDPVISELCSVLYKEIIVFSNSRLQCTSIVIVDNFIDNDSIYISCKSPIVVELDSKTGRICESCSPTDDNFLKLIKQNLIEKYNSLHMPKIDDAKFYITEISKIEKFSKKYIENRNLKKIEREVNGYKFNCKLSGDKRLINMALNSGLGSKNSKGFGFIKKVN